MRNKSFLLLPLLATMLIGWDDPGIVLSSSTPAEQAPIDKMTTVSMNQCNLFVLGWIPVGETKLDKVIEEMRAGAHGLVDVSVQPTNRNFILLTQVCSKITATPFRWLPPPPPPAPPETEEGATDGTAPEAGGDAEAAPTADGAAPDAAASPEAAAEPAAPPPTIVGIATKAPPKKAEALTKRLYEVIGQEPPSDDDAWSAIVAKVWTVRQQNKKSDGEMVLMARSGSALAGPEAGLGQALDRALEDEQKR